MPKGLQRTLDRAALKGGTLRPHVIPFEVDVTVTDGDPGFGSAVIQGLPAGNIALFATVVYLTVEDTAGELEADDFEGDFAIGTAATVDGDVGDAGEANIIASTALEAADSGVSPRTRATNSTAQMIDNTDGDLEMNLNLLIDDADIAAEVTLKATGEIHLVYAVMGDD